MRRLVIEGSINGIKAIFPMPDMNNIKSFEILQFLRQQPAETSLIAHITFNDPQSDNDAFFAGYQEAQLLEQDKDGAFIYYLKKKPLHEDFLDTGGFIVPPFAMHGDIVRMMFVGNIEQIDELLAKIETIGIPYKLISLTDAKFAFDSPLNSLTEKQRTILIEAFNNGYFDVPRRINSEQLATKLKIHHSALNMHLRKAELHIFTHMIKD